MTVPLLNAALVVEIGVDACRALMSAQDWKEHVARFFDQDKRMHTDR